jgi:hypothetical protein
MLAVAIMEQFGWTYEEYLDTPTFVIELITEKIRIDAQRAEQEAKKAKLTR